MPPFFLLRGGRRVDNPARTAVNQNHVAVHDEAFASLLTDFVDANRTTLSIRESSGRLSASHS